MSAATPTYRHGLVVGKFYPPHAGHHLLIRAAAARCDAVTVLVEAATVESIPLADRVAWLRAEHACEDNVTIIGAVCDVPVDMADARVWDAQLAVMRAALRAHGRGLPDAVFSSERYGDELAARLGAEHVCVDAARATIAVSGTACRADLAGHWDLLAPATRAGLAVRVVVVGAESTGTTTVSRALAEVFRARGGVWARTGWVAEYGRDYSEQLWHAARADARRRGVREPDLDELVWTGADFARIAAEQTRRENAAAAAGSPLLVCDTDAFATGVWERRYLGPGSTPASAGGLPRHDVYLLTDHRGVPFVQDGLRDGEHIRAGMTGWFIDALTAAGHPWVLLTGTLDERVALAVRVADQALAQRTRFAPPLG